MLKKDCKAKWDSITRFIKFNKNYKAFHYMFLKFFVQKKLSLSEDEIQTIMSPPETFEIKFNTILHEYNFDSFMYSHSYGVVHLSMNKNQIGRILGVNTGIERIFQYSRKYLVGHNISILMPEPINKYHDIVLTNLFNENRNFKPQHQVNTYGQTCNGNLLQIAVYYKKITNFRGEFELVGLIKEIK